MRKIWTVALAVFGVGGDAFADCYSEAKNLMENERKSEIEFCVESDLTRLKVIKKHFHKVSYKRKLQMSREAHKIMGRVNPGDIVLSNDICTVCVGDEK